MNNVNEGKHGDEAGLRYPGSSAATKTGSCSLKSAEGKYGEGFEEAFLPKEAMHQSERGTASKSF